MEVGVKVMAEDVTSGEVRHIASSYVIYVALDENRRPTPVPPLVPTNDEEKAIIEQAATRRMHWQKIDEELKRAEGEKDR
jgi:acyl-CoA hydrolase